MERENGATVQILPKEMDEYFIITLKHEEAHVQILIYISDLHLIEYRVYKNRSWIGFVGVSPVTVYNLPFTVSYIGSRNFVNKGGISIDKLPLLELGLWSYKICLHVYAKSIKDDGNKEKNNVPVEENHKRIARALLILVQMLCEEIQFYVMSDRCVLL